MKELELSNTLPVPPFLVPAQADRETHPRSAVSEEDLRRAAGAQHTIRIGYPRLLSLTGFLAIALGVQSLLSLWTGLAATFLQPVLLAPDQALGLVFTGFALRLSRLVTSRAFRTAVHTSRVCLLILGLTAVFGWTLFPSATAPASPVAGACFFLIGAGLILRDSRFGARIHTLIAALICVCLGCCWLTLLFASLGLAGVPPVLQLHPVLLLLLTAVDVVLLAAARTPNVLRVLQQGGPEAQAARVMFPLAFAIPLCLAILRQAAESRGWLHADLGLLLHVLLSAGSMALMIIWYANRIHSANRAEASAFAASSELHSQYRELFSVVTEPVWIFDPQGASSFANAAAGIFAPAEPATDPGDSVLGANQQRAILSAAILGRQVTEIKLRHRPSGVTLSLPVVSLRSLRNPRGEPGVVVLIARNPLR